VVAALRVTVHGAVPVQPPPLQVVNVDPEAGVAVSVTEPFANVAAQTVPQLIPFGLLETLPVPVPLRVTVSKEVGTAPTTARKASFPLPGVDWKTLPLLGLGTMGKGTVMLVDPADPVRYTLPEASSPMASASSLLDPPR